MKIVIAGICKTGTKSMRKALEILEYENVLDYFEQLRHDDNKLWYKYIRGEATKEDFIETYKDIDAATDMPFYFMWKEAFEAFPDAKVVLLIRDDEQEWLNSLKNMEQGNLEYYWFVRNWSWFTQVVFSTRLTPKFKHIIKTRNSTMPQVTGTRYPSDGVDDEHAITFYKDYINEVKRTIPKEQLLVFNAKDGWKPLCEFLGKDIPNISYPHLNIKGEYSRGRFEFDTNYVDVVNREMMVLLAGLTAILSLVYVLVFI